MSISIRHLGHKRNPSALYVWPESLTIERKALGHPHCPPFLFLSIQFFNWICVSQCTRKQL